MKRRQHVNYYLAGIKWARRFYLSLLLQWFSGQSIHHPPWHVYWPTKPIVGLLIRKQSAKQTETKNPKRRPRTWLSTNIAISMNMSCSSLIEFSNFIISAWRASISARVCLACCVSIIICKKETRIKFSWSDCLHQSMTHSDSSL